MIGRSVTIVTGYHSKKNYHYNVTHLHLFSHRDDDDGITVFHLISLILNNNICWPICARLWSLGTCLARIPWKSCEVEIVGEGTFERQGCGAVQPPLAPRADPRPGSMFWDPGDGFEAGWWRGFQLAAEDRSVPAGEPPTPHLGPYELS